ncbi:hypothetical protein [Rhizobium sp.]
MQYLAVNQQGRQFIRDPCNHGPSASTNMIDVDILQTITRDEWQVVTSCGSGSGASSEMDVPSFLSLRAVLWSGHRHSISRRFAAFTF